MAVLAASACAEAQNGPQLAGPVMEARINGGPTVLSGTVINEGDSPATVVSVTFVVIDGAGRRTVATYVMNDGAPLAAGDTADFSLEFDGAVEQIRYSIGYGDQSGPMLVLR